MTLDVGDEIAERYPVFSYNATKLSPREVANTFVPPVAFRTLRDARNAILVGPRGSGKTTLLKMLTSEALTAWGGPDAKVARDRVRDVGIFVGVDVMWAEQIQSAEGDSPSFGAAAYALHIARAFTQAVAWRSGQAAANDSIVAPHLPLNLDKSDEIAICERISRLFKLARIAPSFRSLDHAIGDRLTDLGAYRYRLIDGHPLPDWAYLDPLQSVSELARMVNEYANEPDRRWALLFDELELAPASIVTDILRRLRGNESTLVFKLSLAPILRSTDLLVGERGATHGQDLEYIPLTSPDRSDNFVADLFARQRVTTGIAAELTSSEILGESAFDGGDTGGRRPGRVDTYAPGGRVWKAMVRLKRNDPSFASYLEGGGVNLEQMAGLPPADRARYVRKIRNLVIIRDHFKAGSRRDTQATRELYAGEPTMLAVTDGNPRMSTILVRELMGSIAAPSFKPPVSSKAQADAVEATATRFLALLHAQSGIVFGRRALTMVHVVDAIGRALHARLIDAPFSADAPAGFFVDEAVPARFLPLLSQAVNTGAIIHIPKSNSTLPVADSTRGRHYRLSYLLAPRYGLPLRQGKTVALWKLLEGTLIGTTSRESAQPTLLDWAGTDV